MLHFLQIVLHQVEAVDALLEVLREAGKQWRNFGLLEVFKLGNDVVTFLAGLHPFDEILQTMAP